MDKPEACIIVVSKIPTQTIGKRRLVSTFGSRNVYDIGRAMLLDTLERLSRIPRTRKILLYSQPGAYSAVEAILLELNDGAGRKWATQCLEGCDLQSR